MYINKVPTDCTADGQYFTQRGWFLILMREDNNVFDATNVYAILRKVELRQLGPWMMGRARVEGATLSISGAYGNDGLPITMKELPKDAVALPQSLHEAWNNGGGHNGAGSEDEQMRAWAKVAFKEKLNVWHSRRS